MSPLRRLRQLLSFSSDDTSSVSSDERATFNDDPKPFREMLQRLHVSPKAPLSVSLVPHIRQHYTWDCGIACVRMVTQWCRQTSFTPRLDTHSIWTVDLVMMLYHEAGVSRFLFVTNTLAVNEHWQELDFYHAAFEEDCARVSRKLDRMKQLRLPALQLQRLPLSSVLRLIRREDCIAIVLLDNRVLSGNDAETGTYAGHYVVLVGVTPEGDGLFLLNPALDEYPSQISLSSFETAWRNEGTDEDIIFVFR